MTVANLLIIGSGLIGTSVGLALRPCDWQVLLADRDPDAVAGAVERGAGEPWTQESPAPDLVVVAVPPNHVVDVAAQALRRWPQATVTDTASVKAPIIERLDERVGVMMRRFVGGHPLAGREVTGPGGAMRELFRDRPWVLTPDPLSSPESTEKVLDLVGRVGAVPMELSAQEHDRAVALTSHMPQVVASLLANRLNEAEPEQIMVSGQGLRDTVRIAGSDPALWAEILTANSGPVIDELAFLARDLDRLLDRLRAGGQESKDAVYRAISCGRSGIAKLPGKHGSAGERYKAVKVAVPDEPGALAALFSVVADAGVNLEDVRIEHVLGRPTGLVELSVTPEDAQPLRLALKTARWSLRA